MATTNDLKNGMTLNLDGNLMNVVGFQHRQAGKGVAFVRTKLKERPHRANARQTFAARAGRVAILDKRRCSTVPRRAGFPSMDTQPTTSRWSTRRGRGRGQLADRRLPPPYVTFYEGTAIGVELPAAVELEVTETEPGVKGDRVSGATKPATVETGAVVQVPLFVETGDRIKVDTRSGAYLTRVQ